MSFRKNIANRLRGMRGHEEYMRGAWVQSRANANRPKEATVGARFRHDCGSEAVVRNSAFVDGRWLVRLVSDESVVNKVDCIINKRVDVAWSRCSGWRLVAP